MSVSGSSQQPTSGSSSQHTDPPVPPPPQTLLHLPPPAPGSAGAPQFTGTNVTDFIDEWEMLCVDYSLDDRQKVERLPRYCKEMISEYVKSLSEYSNRSWDGLKRRLMKDYIRQDTKAKYYSRAFLEEFKQKSSDGKGGLKNYCLQFRAISARLIARHELDSYTACLWFLQGLPDKRQEKVVRTSGIVADDPSTFDLEAVLAAAERISADEESLSIFRGNNRSAEDLKDLVERRRQDPIVAVSDDPTANNTNGATRTTTETTKTVLEKPDTMDALTKAFNNLTLPLETKLEAKLNTMESMIRQAASAYQPHILQRPQYSNQMQNAQRMMQNQGYQQPQTLSSSYARPSSSGQGQSADQQNLIWGRTPEQENDRNVCRFCNGYGHHKKVCPELLSLIADGMVHLDETMKIAWGPAGEGGPVMQLNNRMRQLDNVRMLLADKARRTAEKGKGVAANHMRVRCETESDTDEEVDEFEENFTYEVISTDTILAASQDKDSQKRRPGRPRKDDVLDKTARVIKNRAKKERGLPTPKTMRSGTWGKAVFGVPSIPGPSGQRQSASEPEDIGGPRDRRSGIVEANDGDREDNDTLMDDAAPSSSQPRRVRFNTREKGKGKRIDDAEPVPKVKNIRLADMLKRMAEANPTHVLQKMLNAVVPDITVEDLLTSGSVAHKLMFKPAKPDVIEKIQVSSAARNRKTVELENVLYSSASPRAVVKVNGWEVSALLDTGAEVNLIEEDTARKIGLPFTADDRMRLVDINGRETILQGICENIEISVGPVAVVQSLLVVEKASQHMVLGMPFASATSMRTQAHENGRVDIEISCSYTGKTVKFQGARGGTGPKTKYLSHLFPDTTYKAELKE